MSVYKPKFIDLPPEARAEAMDRPYRPSRMPWLLGAVITVILHIIFYNVNWTDGPTEARMADLMKPSPRKPVATAPAPVIYQNLHAPIRPTTPRSSAPPRAAPIVDAPAERGSNESL